MLAAIALATAASSSDAADSFYERYISGPGGISPCYARTYSREHLAEHPKQTVTRFYLTRSEYDEVGTARSFDVAFGFMLKTMRGPFSGYATCRPRGDGAACVVEADGGGITLTPRPDGVLVSVDERLEVEGASGFSPDLHASDDREFRLYTSDPESCFFDGVEDGDNAGNQSPVLEPLTPSIERAN